MEAVPFDGQTAVAEESRTTRHGSPLPLLTFGSECALWELVARDFLGFISSSSRKRYVHSPEVPH